MQMNFFFHLIYIAGIQLTLLGTAMESGCNTLRRLNSKTAGISHERSADQGGDESCDNGDATEKNEKEGKRG